MTKDQTVGKSRRSLIGFAIALILGALVAFVMTSRTELVPDGAEAPQFELPSADSARPVSLASLRGKVVVLDFWSTSCPPCVSEMGELEELRRQLGEQGVVVLGINTEGASATLVRDFARARGVSYTMLLDSGSTAEAYRVQRLPTLYLLDRDGKVRWSHEGFTSARELQRRARELI